MTLDTEHFDRVLFFYDNAGYSYNPRTETPEQGRQRAAEDLASAEARMNAGPYFTSIDRDPWGYDGDVPYDGPVWIVSLYRVDDRTEPECIGSFGGVACDKDDPHIRVCAAELASEYIR